MGGAICGGAMCGGTICCIGGGIMGIIPEKMKFK